MNKSEFEEIFQRPDEEGAPEFDEKYDPEYIIVWAVVALFVWVVGFGVYAWV